MHILVIPKVLLSRGLAPSRKRSDSVTVITVTHSREDKTKEMTSTYSYKVILLGERGVGKTTLFKALRGMETEAETEEDLCTEYTSSGGFVGRVRTRSVISTVESQIDTCTKAVKIGGKQIAQVSQVAVRSRNVCLYVVYLAP